MSTKKLNSEIRLWVILVMASIMFSGITAFPIETELKWLDSHNYLLPTIMSEWIRQVYTGVAKTNSEFPFLAYGTDWLAFAHIVIALAYVGVLKDPVRNKWIIDWSILCCILVFPLAFIAGPQRGIPFFHQLIDCSFGLFGLIPILIIRKKISQLEKIGYA